jgi:hypothetical protein
MLACAPLASPPYTYAILSIQEADEAQMKVFISWSESLSREVAEQLRGWLPRVVQSVDPYLSSEDIHKGARWRDEVAKELESSDYGIICVTPENLSSEWMNFEAGALSKKLDGSYVSPFLVRLKNSDLSHGPLAQFQSTVYHDYKDVHKLLKSINSVSERQLRPDDLEEVFRTWWPHLKNPIDELLKKYSARTPVQAGRDAEGKLEEILVLMRGQQKLLTDLEQTHQSMARDAAPTVVNGVDFSHIRLLLSQAYSIADEAAVPGQPETRALVQIRGVIGVIERQLFGKKARVGANG